MKTNEVEIIKLGEQLKRICLDRNLSAIEGFTFMFNAEDGRGIMYVKEMPIKYTGGMRESYDTSSEDFDPEFNDIQWPYTGFVQGIHVFGWSPISAAQLGEWFEKSPYTIKDFTKQFGNKRTTYKKWN